jgi:hypothetical protein
MSCEDTEALLDKNPLGTNSRETYYTTVSAAENAVIACYAQLNGLNGLGRNLWIVGDCCSDDADVGGEPGGNDQPSAQQLGIFAHTPTNEYLRSIWGHMYGGIYRCNLAINEIPNIDFSEAQFNPNGFDYKMRLIAEAKVLRAHYYYYLMKVFGEEPVGGDNGVPLVTRELQPSEYNLPREKASTVWSFIENDILDAIPYLPTKSEFGSKELGRVTKGAAQAHLAKVYLNQGKWDLALEQAEAVINSGEYSLYTNTFGDWSDWTKIWRKSNEHGPGSVFEIVNWNTPNNDHISSLHNIYQMCREYITATGQKQPRGWGFNCPTPVLYSNFDYNDTRRWAITRDSVGEDNTTYHMDTIVGEGALNHFASPTLMYFRKYYSLLSEENEGTDPRFAVLNIKNIRYAEVLLTAAEAAYNDEKEDKARDYVGQVRARVNRPEIESTGLELRNDILRERRIELAGEGQRFYDLQRYHMFYDDINMGDFIRAAGFDGFTDNKNEVFPIPQTEIDATNGAIEQNKGY